ncbi:unnamed protein product [Calypogeia fissa]
MNNEQSSGSNGNKRPFLDHLEAYLARRDGVDKALKILRYSSKVWLATPLLVQLSDPDVVKKVRNFESSVGTSRKAFRLGKFIQDVNALRRAPSVTTRGGFLEFVATAGEGVYYFVEQFVWLVKAGAIDKRHAKQLLKWSAWAEFIGYLGSVTLKSLQVSTFLEQEAELKKILDSRENGTDTSVQASRKLKTLQAKRFMKTLSLIQDLSDSLLALNDITGGQGVLARPFLLALAGLVSALISTHKNWENC